MSSSLKKIFLSFLFFVIVFLNLFLINKFFILLFEGDYKIFLLFFLMFLALFFYVFLISIFIKEIYIIILLFLPYFLFLAKSSLKDLKIIIIEVSFLLFVFILLFFLRRKIKFLRKNFLKVKIRFFYNLCFNFVYFIIIIFIGSFLYLNTINIKLSKAQENNLVDLFSSPAKEIILYISKKFLNTDKNSKTSEVIKLIYEKFYNTKLKDKEINLFIEKINKDFDINITGNLSFEESVDAFVLKFLEQKKDFIKKAFPNIFIALFLLVILILKYPIKFLSGAILFLNFFIFEKLGIFKIKTKPVSKQIISI